MRFGPLPVARAEGAVLAHTLRLSSGTLTKGRVLSAEDLVALQEAGIEQVAVAVLEEGDVGEDEAAATLADAARGAGLRLRGPFTGRCNLLAEEAGLVRVDVERIGRANAVDEALTLSTLPDWSRVDEGELVATAKVIPLGVPGALLDRASTHLRSAEGALAVRPFRPVSAGLVLTTLPGTSASVMERAESVTRGRLESLGSTLDVVLTVRHGEDEVAGALTEVRERGCGLVLILGASAIVDRGDVVPRALDRAGGRVHRLGIPVDPGNLLLLGDLGGDPVVGIPGCARSSRRSGFDTVLERLAVGALPDSEELARLGVGGLLREIRSRPQPRDSEPDAPDTRDADLDRSRIAGVVLAAGRSTRMGEANKLLQEVESAPMVRTVVERLMAAGVDPIVVVTGHEAPRVEGVLEGLPVELVPNDRFHEGMGTSVAAGVAALDAGIEGFLVCLADMPRVSVPTVRGLIDAFRDSEGADAVWVPVYGGKRGNPVLWSASLRAELEDLEGDVGGRTVLSRRPESVREVQVDDPGILLDVDTREALDRLREEEA